MRLMIATMMAAIIAVPATGQTKSAPAFTERAMIDHHNLRRLENISDADMAAQVREIKQNLDYASKHGFNSYVLFSKGFELMVNYDFGLPGGPLFAPDSPHAIAAERFGRALNEVIEYAKPLGIGVIFHSNQFAFPNEVYERYGDEIGGSAKVCPGKDMTWTIFRGKFQEFFRKFPDCAGFQLTTSETQVSPLACQCDHCRHLSAGQRLSKMVSEVWSVLQPLGKDLQLRTWGPVADSEEDYTEMVRGLPKGVKVSTKNVVGDFHIWHEPSKMIGVEAETQILEFDCWREYTGWNYFPCYMGDIFAERLRLSRDRGVKRIAARVNWEPFLNYTFERPFGNEVNVYLFARLAQDPYQDPDAILKDFIASKYPESAWDAAFRLYKRSTELQKVWMTFRKGFAADHSKLWNRSGGSFIRRLDTRMYEIMTDGYDFPPDSLIERRTSIDAALAEAKELVSELGPDVPRKWRGALLRAAENECHVAHGTTDQFLMYRAVIAHRSGRPLPDLDAIEKEMHERDASWQKFDPDAYSALFGGFNVDMLSEVREAVSGGTENR
jgi:hypothetical protein